MVGEQVGGLGGEGDGERLAVAVGLVAQKLLCEGRGRGHRVASESVSPFLHRCDAEAEFVLILRAFRGFRPPYRFQSGLGVREARGGGIFIILFFPNAQAALQESACNYSLRLITGQ